jgi:hypothetical protein
MFYSPHGSFDGSGSFERGGGGRRGSGGVRGQSDHRQRIAAAPRHHPSRHARDGSAAAEVGSAGVLVDYNGNRGEDGYEDEYGYDEDEDDEDDNDPHAYPPLRRVATEAPVGNGGAFAAELARQRRHRRRRRERSRARMREDEAPEPTRGRLWNLVDQVMRPAAKEPPAAARQWAADVREPI